MKKEREMKHILNNNNNNNSNTLKIMGFNFVVEK